jgi:hypothetical protein
VGRKVVNCFSEKDLHRVAAWPIAAFVDLCGEFVLHAPANVATRLTAFPRFVRVFVSFGELSPLLTEGVSMFRRQFLAGLLFAPLALVSSQVLAAGQIVVDADTMKKVLRAPTPDDNAFIDRVFRMVDRGLLPADLVNSTFQWARKKGKNRFHYFKQALILRAADQGITVQP